MARSSNSSRRVPARDRIAKALEEEVRRDFRAGARLPTESQLAQRFGVSTLTIREALAHLAEKGLVERHHGRGTFVLDPASSRHVGIACRLDISAPTSVDFWMPAVHHLRNSLESRGYRVRLYLGETHPTGVPSGNEDAELLADIEEDRLLGVATIAMGSRELGTLAERGIPVIGHDQPHGITVSIRDMMAAGVQRLVDHGCRRVGFLTWGMNEDQAAELFAKAGLPFSPAHQVFCRHPALPGSGYTEFRKLCEQLDGPPDGLLISDEWIFPGASFAILEAGIRVPEQMRIATHANEGARVFSPLPSTAAVVSPARYGDAMAALLARLMRGEHVEPGNRVMAFHLEERYGAAAL